MLKLELPNASVDDIRVIDARGPWDAKSGGRLMVHYALSGTNLVEFLDVDNPAFGEIQEDSGVDIRGLRCYTVRDIPKNSVGGREWHLARTEYVTALAGAALWQCVDPQGGEREFVLDGSQAIIQPSGILHTYTALQDDTCLEVVCNTLFDPNDPRTHDTFSLHTFYELRGQAVLGEPAYQLLP